MSRGSTTHILGLVLGVIALGIAIGLVLLFSGIIKTQATGLGTVLVQASGSATGQYVMITVYNQLPEAITITSIEVRDVDTGIVLNCRWVNSPGRVPPGKTVSYVYDCSRSSTSIVAGHRYAVIVNFRTGGGVVKSVATDFAAS